MPPISLFNPVETATAVTSFPITRFTGQRNLQNAVYFQDFINIHPKLQVLFGGRYDGYQHYDFDYLVGESLTPENKFHQNPFTYRVGAISPLAPFMSLYANWATSFTAQIELSEAGNPLKPETGQQFEAGARFRLAQDRVNFNVAYFHIHEFNVALARPDGVIIQANGITSWGGEAELRARMSQKLNL